MKGVFLATQSVSKSILGEAPEIFCFQINNSNTKNIANAPVAMINNVKVLPVINFEKEQ